MKILLSHKLEKRISGMWSWQSTFVEGMKKFHPEIEVTDQWCEDFDIYLVCSTTSLENKHWLDQAKQMGKKVVLRTGNLPKQSRNRENVIGRLTEYIKRSDEVIWQSDWAREYIAWGDIPRKGSVIRNGVNTDIFNTWGARDNFRNDPNIKKVYLYVQSSSDPCKRPDEAFYLFSQKHRKAVENGYKVKLVIAGRIFNPKWLETNFDFVRGEDVVYLGEILDSNKMAAIMRGCNELLAPSYNEAGPNLILEAKACGLDLSYSLTGGTPEYAVMINKDISWKRMCEEYYKVFKRLLTNEEW